MMRKVITVRITENKLMFSHTLINQQLNSLFCVCCWTAKSSPPLERLADTAV